MKLSVELKMESYCMEETGGGSFRYRHRVGKARKRQVCHRKGLKQVWICRVCQNMGYGGQVELLLVSGYKYVPKALCCLVCTLCSPAFLAISLWRS